MKLSISQYERSKDGILGWKLKIRFDHNLNLKKTFPARTIERLRFEWGISFKVKIDIWVLASDIISHLSSTVLSYGYVWILLLFLHSLPLALDLFSLTWIDNCFERLVASLLNDAIFNHLSNY